MYGCESWAIKKAKCRRIDAFELWCWRRLLRVPWTARSNQSILKEISLEYSLEGLMLKLKLQYFDHLMWRIDSGEKTADAGKDWRQEEKGTTEDEMVGWHHWLDGHEFEQAPGVGDGQGRLECCSPWGHKELDRTERLNWMLQYSFMSPVCVLVSLVYLTAYSITEYILYLLGWLPLCQLPCLVPGLCNKTHHGKNGKQKSLCAQRTGRIITFLY